MSLRNPGNVERPAVETQVSRMTSGKMWPVEWDVTEEPR